MKILFPSILLALISSCKPDLPPILAGTENQFNLVDSTYVEAWENLSFGKQYSAFNKLIPSLDSFDQAIRLHKTAGWGQFEYLCSLYDSPVSQGNLMGHYTITSKDENNQLIEYDQYIDQTKFLSKRSIDSLLNSFHKLGIDTMTTQLYPETYCDDCTHYYLAIKNNDYKKVIYWTQSDIDWGFTNVNIVMDIYQKLLDFLNYPYRGGVLQTLDVTGDSTTYGFGTLDDNILIEIKLKILKPIKSLRFKVIDFYGPGITVANQDTINILQKLQFYGVQESGDTIFLKSSKIIDFR